MLSLGIRLPATMPNARPLLTALRGIAAGQVPQFRRLSRLRWRLADDGQAAL